MTKLKEKTKRVEKKKIGKSKVNHKTGKKTKIKKFTNSLKGGYNKPFTYFGGPFQTSLTNDAKLTTQCNLPPDTTWTCYEPKPQFRQISHTTTHINPVSTKTENLIS